MKRTIVFIISTLILVGATWAQTDSKYLEGAVPVTDGKVTFTHTYLFPELSQAQLFECLQEWNDKRFVTNPEQGNWGRTLLVNAEQGQLIDQGCEYIIFSDRAFAMNRAKTFYRVYFAVTKGEVSMRISDIYYIYGEKDKKVTAEEWITDEVALNKDKTKLAYTSRKFRTGTIDLVNNLIEDLHTRFAVRVSEVISPYQESIRESLAQTQATSTPTESLQGYTAIRPDQIPGNIIKMLSENWMLITAGQGSQANPMTASWGGLGHLYNKPVAFCFIHPTRHTYTLMEQANTYTLTFYTEASREALRYCGTHTGRNEDKAQAAGLTPLVTPKGNTAYRQAWMIIECRKLISQPLSPEAIESPELLDEWDGKPLHKKYIGEILNVWVR